ncbi:serine kinase [Brevifollis gellanilyticus]|nr:serine kinase [Brevifollis gellanilyticus]
MHTLPGDVDDVKMIGAYLTRVDAVQAVDRLRGQPGFCDHPKIVDPQSGSATDMQGFHINEYELGKDHWTEGYVAV